MTALARIEGDGFTVEVDGPPATLRMVVGERALLRTVPAGDVPGVGVRRDGRWTPAGPPTGLVEGSLVSSVFLPCEGAALRVTVRGNRITMALEGPAPERLGCAFALDDHWLGQGTFLSQPWPLSAKRVELDPFETMDRGRNIQSPAWITSGGLAMCVPGHPDLACSWNSAEPGAMTLHARDRASLDLWVSASADARAAAQALLRHVGPPRRRPPHDLLARPIWTTWAEYKQAITQEVVLGYARRIVDEGFPRSVMEIDDIWQRAYGDLVFDEVRFPDPKGMVEELHAMGFAVTCWVPWFVDEGAHLFAEGDARGYFVPDPDTGGTAIIPWWCTLEPGGALLDLRKGDVMQWWTSHLRDLCDDAGVDGFKFDAGEASPHIPERLRGPGLKPNAFSDQWASLARLFPYAEARTGWWAQRFGVPMRQWDKFSTWDPEGGLACVVPQAMAMSLIGYPFILPDMVGGNEYGNECTPELMVRWAQASALLPIVQFSVAPWRWGPDATDLVRRTTRWREAHAGLLDRLADEAVATGTPIVRPVFWLAPDDERALRCGDEFLLSNDLLVAPVVVEGATARDVYLPPGRWVDRTTGETHSGAAVLEACPAPLDVLPCFGREGSGLDGPLEAE